MTHEGGQARFSAMRAIQMHSRSKGEGFSLIELLIVVAIILIIAAIAIPNFMRSRIAANHAAAVSSLRVINSAEMTYSMQYAIGYTSTLSNLGPPASGSQLSSSAADLIDNILASGVKGGYVFTYTPGAADANGHYQQYTINADPSQVGRTGNTYYFTDQTYVIRLNPDTTASSSDSPLN
jgi:type IV pilus assembly protein PilA